MNRLLCTITEIYDQSPRHNNLAIEGAGGAGGADVGAPANALRVTEGGHQVYGVEISAGMGYRDDATSGVAVNGLFQSSTGGSQNSSDTGSGALPFVTALLKNNGQNYFALKQGNAQSGGLTAEYSGAEPTAGGYSPMHQEGAIVLGTGGDDSNGSIGSFFEGAMTAGLPTDAADSAVQASIVPVGYGGPTSWRPGLRRSR